MNPAILSTARRLALVSVLIATAAGPACADEMSGANPDKPDVPPSVLRKFDKNKNGVLDEQELARWEAEKAARREKYASERAGMLAKFDTDGDGKISEAERAAGRLKMSRDRTEADVVKAREKDIRWKAEQEKIEQEKAEKSAAEAKAKAEKKSEPKTDTAKPADGGDTMSGDSMMMQ